MYYDVLKHPRPRPDFETPFNNVPGSAGLQPLTIIDTRLSLQRFEGSGKGEVSRNLTNQLECEIINNVLFRIYENRGNFDLDNNVMVSSPYVSQKEMLRSHLHSVANFCSNHAIAPGLKIQIDTIDASQGSERCVTIISLTRSNRAGDVGFLRDNKRLNVAFTRAKHLLVLVGDFSTITNIGIAQHVYNMAADNTSRTSLQFNEPYNSTNVDQSQVHQRSCIIR